MGRLKNILFGLVLGFILNSGLRSYHHYLWWKTEATISSEKMNEAYERCGHFCAVEEKSRTLLVLKYVLVYFHYRPDGTLVINYP